MPNLYLALPATRALQMPFEDASDAPTAMLGGWAMSL
jgi:hypothetical protein